MERCKWNNLEHNPVYVEYHDKEWGVPSYDDTYLFEMLLLESFHCGLSWLLVLKKRAAFREAFLEFNPRRVAGMDAVAVDALCENPAIIRNRAKIEAAIQNANAFLAIQREFTSFSNYIWAFTDGQIRYGDFAEGITHNALSDAVSRDLKRRGFKFMGTVTTYSYLEAIGVMNNHAHYCFKYHRP